MCDRMPVAGGIALSPQCTIQAAGRTLSCRARTRNDDALALDVRAGLYVVADGISGRGGGDVASDTAVRAVIASFHGLEAVEGRSDALRLLAAVEQANRSVLATARRDPSLCEMGTTLAAVVARPDRVVVAHVGDTRVYQMCDRAFERLTRDHTVNAGLVRRGLIPERAMCGGALDGVLERSIGREETVHIDVRTFDACEGDAVLLCSDGVWQVVSEAEMADVLRARRGPDAAVDRLMSLVGEKGAPDDATAIVVQWTGGGCP
jgi:protein phosphatase